jgi:integral membrane protein
MTLRNFKLVALIEATTYLLLLLASIVKHAGEQPLGVEVLGPIHGFLFITYVVMALALRDRVGWTPKQTLLILIGAVVPFGGYVVDRWIDNNNAAILNTEGRAS